jgi:hypothetical protein
MLKVSPSVSGDQSLSSLQTIEDIVRMGAQWRRVGRAVRVPSSERPNAEHGKLTTRMMESVFRKRNV